MPMNWIKKFAEYGAVIIFTLMLLEFASFLILNKNNDALQAVKSNFIFEKLNGNGDVIPNKDSVLPVKKNFSLKWNSQEFSVTVKTNKTGLRENFDVDLRDVQVAFFGDSFTFGHGVESYERYTDIFRNEVPKLDNKAVSMSYKNGFEPEHYEFFLKNHSELKPKLVIIGVYLGNDLGSDILETNYNSIKNSLELPYRKITDRGQIANSAISYRYPFNYLAEKSYFASFFLRAVGKSEYRSLLFKKGFDGPNAPNSVDLELGLTNLSNNNAIKSLSRIKSVIENRGGKLLVLLIPQNYFFDNKVKNPHIHQDLKNRISEVVSGNNLLKQTIMLCMENGIDCFDPTPNLSSTDYFDLDAHWTRSGHKKTGLALYKYAHSKKYL